jgi:hypothetical protein
MGLHDARNFPCVRCGGHVGVVVLSRELTCPYCHQVQAIPQTLLRELTGHAALLEAQARAASTARNAAANASREAAEQGPFEGQGWLIWIVCIVGPAAVLQAITAAVRYFELLTPSALSTLEMLGSLASSALMWGGLGAYVLVWRLRARVEHRSAPAVPLPAAICPSCGAPTPFAQGEIVSVCAYCGAGLAASQGAMGLQLDHAQAEARAALMTRRRAERRSVVSLTGPLRKPEVRLLLECLLFLFGLGAAFLVPMFEDHPGRKPQPYDFEVDLAVAAFVLLGWLGIVGWTLLRFERMRRWQRVIHALARRLGGRAEFEPKPVVSWFDTYWVGDFRPDGMQLGAYGGTVAGMLDGYPVLAIVDPRSWSNLHSPAVELLVAAVFPGDPHEPPRDERRLWLEQQGFYVQSNQGGLIAHASEACRKNLATHPDQVTGLAERLGVLVRIATALGTRPAPAMP